MRQPKKIISFSPLTTYYKPQMRPESSKISFSESSFQLKKCKIKKETGAFSRYESRNLSAAPKYLRVCWFHFFPSNEVEHKLFDVKLALGRSLDWLRKENICC